MDEVKDEVLAEKNDDIDTVLNSVSDEYISKKKRKRKITYSTLLSVLLAIATIIIVLASIRVDLKPSFLTHPSSYSIYISGSEKMYIDETSEEYEEFYKAYSNSFNVSYLSALFTGKLGEYKIEESPDKGNKFYANETNKTGISSTLSTALGSNYIKLEYFEEQQVKKANGDTYYSAYNSVEELRFEDVYFPLNTENKDSDLTFYLGTVGAGNGYTITKITVRANTFALYEFATQK